MNGLLKEELSGWNAKESIRKRTTKKHNNKKNYNKLPHQRGRSVKFAQKMIHKQVRTSVRDWLNKANWEKERKRPCYEKSLDWYLD